MQTQIHTQALTQARGRRWKIEQFHCQKKFSHIFTIFRNVRNESHQIVALVFWFWLRNLFRRAISYRHDQFALKNNQRQAQPTVTTVERNDEVQFLDKFLNFFDCMMLKKSPSHMNAEKLFLCILSHNIIFCLLIPNKHCEKQIWQSPGFLRRQIW